CGRAVLVGDPGMTTDPNRAKSIFLNAAEIASPDQRDAYLGDECQGDEALRREVEDLLRHHEPARAFLEPPERQPAATIDQPAAERPCTVIGPYTLLKQ